MQAILFRSATVLFCLLAVAGCSSKKEEPPEQGVDQCVDGKDNDADGYTDCDDSECAVLQICQPPGTATENTAALCQDGVDNDGDGTVDCADTGCEPLLFCHVLPDGGTPPGLEETVASCTDMVDNDGDGTTDCADTGCKALLLCAQPGTCQCDDGFSCTIDTCNPQSGACIHAVRPDYCLINGNCWPDGSKNGGTCEVCNAVANNKDWTPIVGGCTIAGTCYQKGERNNNGCMFCDPTRSATDWTQDSNPACTVGGFCFAAGETDSSGCQVCDPNKSKTALSPVTTGCSISNLCYPETTKHPSLSCSSVTCNTSVSTSAWTVAGNECLIGGSCYEAGDKSPNGCNECIPSQSKTSWTPASSACTISGSCYANFDPHPSPTCTSVFCNASVSTNSWTVGGNECLISGVCRQVGDKTNSGCQMCDPAQSKTAWSQVTSGCNISGSCYPDGFAHPSASCHTVTCNQAASTSAWTVNGNECLIGGTCYAAGDRDQTGCFECNPASSKTQWSPYAGACYIGGTCYQDGANHPSSSCAPGSVLCDTAASNTAWTVAGNVCLIGGQCYPSGAADPSGCNLCQPSSTKTAWTSRGACATHLFSALNEGHNGSLGGIPGANALCAAQAADAGYPGTWLAFLSSSTQDVKNLITDAGLLPDGGPIPVTNTFGGTMYNSWAQVFTQPQWNNTATYVYSFNGTNVRSGFAFPDWSLGRGWHGSTDGGTNQGNNCSDWASSSSLVSGAGGDWDTNRQMFNNGLATCNATLAVGCVLVDPVP